MLDVLEEVTRSAARITAALDTLTDEGTRAPSALPGWTRGHVISHVAHGVGAYRRLLATARTGIEPTPRTDAKAFARAVREGADRPAAELATDLRGRLAGLAEDAGSMPVERRGILVTALAGWQHPAWYTLHRCWRELETHHVDLNVGYRTTDWPATYVTWALDDTLRALAARDFPVTRVDALDIGRSWAVSPGGPAIAGSGHALLGWLSGRAPASPLTSDRPLPIPPDWPLPPAPGTWPAVP
ncbi:maleylpyruvate isomerase family mycothiol-dependent enzyme [Streptomyces sp. NRRL S-87]|uniref:maleylpyruvate isomerase family mycothiol-dependent enzyme n=1 Tax=Streptomyces sp. NRRL S-87 TaxID=1463920 RepID=UPI0004C04DAF|nr:maleylpyruvate isomerase family mycothiol-dependent enzyme [Streptomyces sp. NRRL S-87]